MKHINLDDVPHVPFYKPFEGAYVETMPALRAEGRAPLSIAGLMTRRLQVLESGNQELIDNWWDCDLDSGTGLAYYGNTIKIIKNPRLLLNINENVEIPYAGARIITRAQFYDLKGEVISYSKVKHNLLMPKEEVIKHPIWNAVAGNNLLKKYARAHFQKYGVDSAMAFVGGPDEGNDKPAISALVLEAGDPTGHSSLGEANLQQSDAYSPPTLIGVHKLKGIEAII